MKLGGGGALTLQELTDQINAIVDTALADDGPILEAPPGMTGERPTSWDNYVGQERVRRRLEIAIASALARGERAEHMLLMANPGQGKTTLAMLIALLLGRQLVVLTKPPKADQLRQACERAANGVLFVDEVHRWSTAMQYMLMDLTESGTLDGDFGPQDFRGLTVVAATTDPQQLDKALVDRFGCKLKLDPYSEDDMTRIAEGMAARCWPEGHEPLDTDTCAVLARAAAGVPRNLRSLVFAGRDLVLAGEEPTAGAILVLCDTEPDGCQRVHLDLLARLAASSKGSAGLSTLTSMLRMSADEIRQAEQLLVDRRYIALTGSGRTITPAGRARLAVPSIRDAVA